MDDLGVMARPGEYNRALYSHLFLLGESEADLLQGHLDSIPVKTAGSMEEGLLPQKLPVQIFPQGITVGRPVKAIRTDVSRWEVEYCLGERDPSERGVRPGDLFLYPKFDISFSRKGSNGIVNVTPYLQVIWSTVGGKTYPDNSILPGECKWAFTEIIDKFFDERYGEGERGIVNSRWLNWDGINFAPLQSVNSLVLDVEHIARNVSLEDLKKVEMLREQLYGRNGALSNIGRGEAENYLRRSLYAGIYGLHSQAVGDIVERINGTRRAQSKLVKALTDEAVLA